MLTTEAKFALLEVLASGACFLDAIEEVSTKFNLNDSAKAELTEYGLSI